jgi:hypothetical protein
MQLRGTSDGRDDGSSEPVEATSEEFEELGVARQKAAGKLRSWSCWRILSGMDLLGSTNLLMGWVCNPTL